MVITKIKITQIMDWIIYAAYIFKWSVKYKIFLLLFGLVIIFL